MESRLGGGAVGSEFRLQAARLGNRLKAELRTGFPNSPLTLLAMRRCDLPGDLTDFGAQGLILAKGRQHLVERFSGLLELFHGPPRGNDLRTFR